MALPGAKPGETIRPNERTESGDNGPIEDDDSSGSVFTQFGDSNALVGLATGSIGFAAGYLGYQRLRANEPDSRGPNRPR